VSAYWEFYVTNLADKTTGDVAVVIGDDFQLYRPYEIKGADLGNWTFDEDAKTVIINVTLEKIKVTLDEHSLPTVDITVEYQTGTAEGKPVYTEVTPPAEFTVTFDNTKVTVMNGSTALVNEDTVPEGTKVTVAAVNEGDVLYANGVAFAGGQFFVNEDVTFAVLDQAPAKFAVNFDDVDITVTTTGEEPAPLDDGDEVDPGTKVNVTVVTEGLNLYANGVAFAGGQFTVNEDVTFTAVDPADIEPIEPVAGEPILIGYVGYGAIVRITAGTEVDDLEFVVTVNKSAIDLDDDGQSVIGAVTKNILIAAIEPPVYTEDLLVTLGQKDQNVVVVFTALDIYDVDEDAELEAGDDPVYIQKTIPTITVSLQLNFWYYNEFEDVTPDEYNFSVVYEEVIGEDAAFEISEDDFATEIDKLGSEYKDAYQNAYAITGSYVFGDKTVDLFKTAYKPVTAPAPALEA
jgi:hypothetical protein